MEEAINQLEAALLSVDSISSEEILNKHRNIPPIELIEQLVMPVLDRIGSGWEKGTVALSQVYMSGKFIEEWVDTILPSGDPNRKYQPKLAIAVLEDYHMLGKRIVYSVLRASSFDLKDYGHISVRELVTKVKEDKIEVLLISTLMLPSALKVRELKDELIKTNSKVKIIVGGAPFRFDDKLWNEVGADAMALDAYDSINIIEKIMEEKK